MLIRLVLRLRIYEHKVSVNKPKDNRITPGKDILLGICRPQSWNGALPNTTLPRSFTEGVGSGGCGKLELYIQFASINLSS